MQMIQHTGSYLFKQIVTECKSTSSYILSTCRNCLICLVAGDGEKKLNNSLCVSTEICTFIDTYSQLYIYCIFGHLDV